jgi:CubicO group peptidase (beta-lactamase class C family)
LRRARDLMDHEYTNRSFLRAVGEVTRIAMSEIQEQIQRHIDALVGTGAETGVQVAVYQDGALIVDAVAGTADPATGRPVTSGTPIFSFSTVKT